MPKQNDDTFGINQLMHQMVKDQLKFLPPKPISNTEKEEEEEKQTKQQTTNKTNTYE